ncbi:MAG: hypothetical protein COA78_06135 [Blastopirellula sp.]|nr:MAG: hypothetical protein COA78_06135 [Blastopirellula sp.]
MTNFRTTSEHSNSDFVQDNNLYNSSYLNVKHSQFTDNHARYTSENYKPNQKSFKYLKCRFAFDRLAAFILIIVLGPLLLLLGMIVQITSQGPAIYTQTRLGQYGRKFRIFKFRSMSVNAEKSTGAIWAKLKDPRVTIIGRFLRRSHLDELPQLFNVVMGDMTLIGPRPERPEIATTLDNLIESYNDRLLVRPGMTGLAQVSLPADTDLSGVRRKTIMDREYIENAKLFLDIHILFCTLMLSLGLQKKLTVHSWMLLSSASHSDSIEQQHSDVKMG